MLTAYDKDGNYYIASKDLEKKKYYCPSCKGRVFLKVGNKDNYEHGKISHFAHCPGLGSHDWESESYEHLFMKLGTYNYFKNFEWVKSIKMEHMVIEGDLKLIPDILIETNNNEKIAIECQYSVYSPKKIKDKTTEYSELDIYTLWIFYNRDEFIKKHFKNAYSFLSLCYNADIIKKGYNTQKYYMYNNNNFSDNNFDNITSLEILHNYYYDYGSFRTFRNLRHEEKVYFNDNVIFNEYKLESLFDLKLVFSVDELKENCEFLGLNEFFKKKNNCNVTVLNSKK